MTNFTFAPGFHTSGGRQVDAAAYESYIGRWSRMFVHDLFTAAEVANGDAVLDVATGTGEAAVVARSLLRENGFIVGTDISAAMLTVASARMSGGPFAVVAADGQALPFRDGIFGAVVCQLGLMFFHDTAKGLAEFRRVLRSDRRAAACVISSPERAPMWGLLAEALSRHLPAHRDTLFLSFTLADEMHLRRLFLDAGFRDVRASRARREAFVASFDEYWAPIERGVGLMPQAYVALPAPAQRAVRASVRRHLARFKSDGGYVLGVEMLIASGRR